MSPIRPVTSKFLAALRGPHRIRTQVDAYYGGVPVGTDLPLVEGDISGDRGSVIRRSLSATFPGTLAPTKVDSPLSPYGSQLRVTKALVYPDGTEEPVTLGTFRINTANEGDDHTWAVEASDLFAIIDDAKFLTPYSVPATATIAGTIQALILNVLPGAVFNVDGPIAGSLDRPGPVTFETDRAAAITELAASIGAECYATAGGGFRLAEIPDLDTWASVWTVDTGPRGVLISAPRSQSREDVYNGVIIRAEDTSGSSGVWQYIATDDRLVSPTYWLGPFGQVPTEYSSPTIRTVDQAAKAAKGILREHLGQARALNLAMVPNFALEPGDVITVVKEDGISEAHLIETLSIPLTAEGDMTATTRGRVQLPGAP